MTSAYPRQKKRRLGLQAVLIYVTAIFGISYPAQAGENFYDVHFVHCYDGDTCKFILDDLPRIFGHHISVRVKGIDTPEIRGTKGEEKSRALLAKYWANTLLEGAGRIDLIDCSRGKYFRLACYIIADHTSLGYLQMQKGLAHRYE